MNANQPRQGRSTRPRLTGMLVVVASLTFAAREVAQEPIDPVAATVVQWFTMIEGSRRF